MIDFLKFHIKDLGIIYKVLALSNLKETKNKKGYSCYSLGNDIQLSFKKVYEGKQMVGYGYLHIGIRLHNIFNKGIHNGNDFNAVDCIKTLQKVLDMLGIQSNQYDMLKVVNVEFGVNIVPKYDSREIIAGFKYYKRVPFIVNKFPYNRITNASTYKQIKVYAKGLQMHERGIISVPIETVRIEVKTNQSKNIKRYGLQNANDLFKPQLYSTFKDELLKEFDLILWFDSITKLSVINAKDKKKFKRYLNINFWNKTIESKRYHYNKKQYIKILTENDTAYSCLRKVLIIKLNELSFLMNSTKKEKKKKDEVKNMINKCLHEDFLMNSTSRVIKVENVKKMTQKKECETTGLNISMQKEKSRFLCVAGLRYYKENKPEIYKSLENEYLNSSKKVESIERQLYYIAHNIRNRYYNKKHNNKRRYSRMYPKEQIQLNFKGE